MKTDSVNCKGYALCFVSDEKVVVKARPHFAKWLGDQSKILTMAHRRYLAHSCLCVLPPLRYLAHHTG